MALHPRLHARMFMGSVIVNDQVQIHFRRRLKIDRFKEPDKLLMPVSRHAVAYNSSIKRRYCSKQSYRTAVQIRISAIKT